MFGYKKIVRKRRQKLPIDVIRTLPATIVNDANPPQQATSAEETAPPQQAASAEETAPPQQAASAEETASTQPSGEATRAYPEKVQYA